MTSPNDTAKTEWTDWIDHKLGDVCPVTGADAHTVEVRFRDGLESTCADFKPDTLWWGAVSNPEHEFREIIAYRTLKEPSP